MLADVLDTVRGAGGDPIVLATIDLPEPVAAEIQTPTIVDDRPLSAAVDAHLEVGGTDEDVDPGARGSEPAQTAVDGTAVVMSDLALATPHALRGTFDAPDGGEVAAAPGLGGGTNVLVVRHPDFSPDYHGTSFRDHRAGAETVGATFHTVDSFRLAVDVDGPDDLPEVLLHGRGRSADWLADAGFEVVVTDGRARVERDPD